jgi:large subunit ribosomal protein L10
MTTKKPVTHVSEEKKQAVKNLAQKIKEGKCIMLVSIKNIPSSQLQKIKKDLRGKASIEVAKKTILLRAIDEAKVEELMKLKDSIQEDMGLLISNDDAFEISALLTDNKNPIGAKEGQIAEADITIDEGPTELVPGPVISELGSLGLQIMVEDGKITIRKSKIAVKKGDKVTGSAASIFQKLGIKPFMIGLNPLAFYDSQTKKVYVGVKIDKKAKLAELLGIFAKARGFAVNMTYPTKETIGMILGKANSHANALSKLQKAVQPAQTQ